MRKYKMTQANLSKFVGKDTAVVFEKECEISNIKILAKVQVQRDYNGQVSSCPNVMIGEKTYSPHLLSAETLREAGWETFSI